jgi:hypothetical protein
MARVALFFSLAVWLCVSSASAQVCGPYPNNLQNNTTADATQVMANFNAVLACVNAQPALRSYLAGLTMSNDASNTVIDSAAGIATSDDQTTLMTLASAFSKNVNAAWSPGSGTSSGCLDTGNLQPSTWYHLFVIARTDTGAVDELCSTSAAAPAMPTNYTKKRRVGSFKTDGSSHILIFSQNGDEFLWAASVNENGASLSTTGTAYTLQGVPPGIKVNALLVAWMSYGATATNVLIYSPDITAPNGYSLTNLGTGYSVGGQFNVRTNTSQQIMAVATNGSGISFAAGTMGWVDTRGRFN